MGYDHKIKLKKAYIMSRYSQERLHQ